MKKILLSLVIGIVGLLSFSDAGNIEPQSANLFGNTTLNANAGYCYMLSSNQGCINFVENGITSTLPSNTYIYCFADNGTVVNTCGSMVSYKLYDLSNIVGGSYTSEECQQEYGLMPIDSCNSEYCEMNNLCTGSNNSNWSLLYINDVLHEGAPIINVKIPEEIQRDYTGNLKQFDLDIQGYGYDQDKMQQMVNTQRMTPDGNEMSNLISKIADFLPLIAVALLIIRIWLCVKKVFKF